MGKKSRVNCRFCENHDFPIIVKKPGKIIEVYCSRCGEMVRTYKIKKKPNEFYRKIVEY